MNGVYEYHVLVHSVVEDMVIWKYYDAVSCIINSLMQVIIFL